MAEQWPFKPLVAGSSPATLTSFRKTALETRRAVFVHITV
jgi:hypothetical protein